MSEKPIQSESIELEVSDGARMGAFVARPASGAAPHGLLLFQEAFGVNHHIRALAERFAGAGYLTLAPELYHRSAPRGFEAAYTDFDQVRTHMQALSRTGMEADIQAAHAWLHNANGIAAEKIVASGYCLGGRAATLANIVVPLAAAASYYGANLHSLVEDFDKLHGPLLLVWGDKDTHIPVAQRTEAADALRKAGKSFIELTFGDASHGFSCDERAAYHAPSAHIAWAATLAFFHQHTPRH